MNNTKATNAQLVDSLWVQQNLGAQKTHFIEVGCSSPLDYTQFHLPGAVFLDIDSLEGDRFWNVYRSDRIFRSLSRHYTSRLVREMMLNTTVLYGTDQSCVCRAAVILMALGFRHISIVNGGKTKLITDHVPMTRTITRILDPEMTPARPKPAPKLILDYKELQALDPNTYDLISIRSLDEFNGVTSGYTYFDTKGRIPNSIHGEDISFYRNPNQTMIHAQKIIDTLDLNNGRQKIFYCGTGWRASEVAFYVLSLGYDCSVYDGGWYEWSHLNKSN